MDTTTSSKRKKFYTIFLIWALLPVPFFIFFLILSIICGNLPPETYSNKEIISMCVEKYYQEKEKINDIALALHNTHYNERFVLGYTKSFGYTFGPHELNESYGDILRKVKRLYPDGWSFPFYEIIYTPELIKFNSFISSYGYFAYLVMSNLSEEEMKKEFPRMDIYSGNEVPRGPNCFYRIEGDWYVYFSRGRIEPKFPDYVPTLDSAVSNFNFVKDTLNYVVDVLLKANPSDTLWMRNYDSKYLPGFFDIYKEKIYSDLDELLPHQTYKESISKYLDAYFREEFYYFIRYYPDNKLLLSPKRFEGCSYLYCINPNETINRDYPDFVIYDNCNNKTIKADNYLYKIDDNWFIMMYKDI